MTKKVSSVKSGVSNTHGIIFEKTHKVALLKKLLMGLVLICHQHNNKDLSHLQSLSAGMQVNTRYVLFLMMHLWRSLCTLYLLACQLRVTIGNSGLCCCAGNKSTPSPIPCLSSRCIWKSRPEMFVLYCTKSNCLAHGSRDYLHQQ